MSAPRVRSAAVLALAALLGGCAVTRIDVDVYKGPLANHEEVRWQQFTVLATTAKTFLVRLRDTLEWGDCRDLPQNKAEIDALKKRLSAPPLDAKDVDFESLRYLVKGVCASVLDSTFDIETFYAHDYRADFMPFYPWRNRKAERVNAILSLYKDQGLPELEEFFQTAIVARRKNHDAMAIVEYRVNGDAWKTIERGLRPDRRDHALTKAYRRLLDPTDEPKERLRGKLLLNPITGNASLARADELFEKLANGEVVHQHAADLFADPTSKKAKLFVTTVRDSGQAFHNARQSLRDLWVGSLEMLIAVNPTTTAEVAPASAAARDAVWRRNAQRSKATRTLAAVAVATMQAQLAYFALCEGESRVPAFKSLRAEVEDLAPSRFDWKATSWSPKEHDSAKAAFEIKLRQDPAATARTLLLADQQIRSLHRRTPDFKKCPAPVSIEAQRSPVYGLVRGPVSLGQANEDIDAVVRNVQVGTATGFERGRLPEGLETLQEQVQDLLAPERAHGREDAVALREFFLLAQVGFAEKVVSLANHDALEDTGDPLRNSRGATVNRYRAILQAFGNALLVQADDFKQSEDHLRALRKGGAVERQALDAALNQTAAAYLGDLVNSAHAVAEAAKAASDAAATAEAQAKMVATRAVAETIKQLRDELLDDKKNETEPAVAAHDRLRARLQQKLDAETNSGTKANLQRAKDFVAARNPPMAPYRMPKSSDRTAETSRDVLDTLIATLREEHVLATREDPSGPRAKAAAAALEAAYGHRGSMAYLRPAIAYLRSSYAATTLQASSGATEWSNLLQESAGRASPLFSEWLSNPSKEIRQITSEIDKQFWQTINTVRVSGAGLTNYVMVKDDIGNWYVKQYSADPRGIINSAKALALFNFGAPGLPSPAPQAAGTGTTVDTAAAAGAAAGATTGQTASTTPDASDPLSRLAKRHRGTYESQTKAAYDNVVNLEATLAARIAAAWDADKDLTAVRAKLDAQLEAERKTLTADLDKLKTDKPDAQGPAIVDALHAGRRFHNRLTTTLRVQLRDKPEEQTAAAKAADYVTIAARDVLGEFVRARKESVAEYSRSITFIGEANR